MQTKPETKRDLYAGDGKWDTNRRSLGLTCLQFQPFCSGLNTQLSVWRQHKVVLPSAVECVAQAIERYEMWIPEDGSGSGGLVVATAARRSMVEVDVTVVRPEAAVVEAHDIIEPVGVPGHPWGLPVWRRAPVVSPVRGTATNGISRQNQIT